MFAIATNVCPADDCRIQHTVPSWLRVWGSRLSEILIVVDPERPTGRIAGLHGDGGEKELLREVLSALKAADPRVRVTNLPTQANLDQTLARWFGSDRPMRCQAGTPIAAFVYAIDQIHSDRLLRCDCDMFFYGDGLVDEANTLLDQGIDLVEPPRLGRDPAYDSESVSTRALFLDRTDMANNLPITAHRLDWIRRVHRLLRGKPTYLAFEQMLECEVSSGRLSHKVLDHGCGYSLHVPSREDFLRFEFDQVVDSIESGDVPQAQIASGRNFSIEAWSDRSSDSLE